MIKNMGATRTEFGDGLKANAESTLEGDLRGAWKVVSLNKRLLCFLRLSL